MDVTRHIVIRGRVQGVGFRNWTADVAQRLDLRGFVRNRRDGTVEALFRGPADIVDEMIELCREGPALARVDAIIDQPGSGEGLMPAEPGFVMLPTL
ncbi:MAG TPA: acylphosphatase [Xanthobacteraceae bacterium]|nr:acylphosphatase [Xanthobacteraceae bacterium]